MRLAVRAKKRKRHFNECSVNLVGAMRLTCYSVVQRSAYQMTHLANLEVEITEMKSTTLKAGDEQNGICAKRFALNMWRWST